MEEDGVGVEVEEDGVVHGLAEVPLAIYLHGRDLDGFMDVEAAGGYLEDHGMYLDTIPIVGLTTDIHIGHHTMGDMVDIRYHTICMDFHTMVDIPIHGFIPDTGR